MTGASVAMDFMPQSSQASTIVFNSLPQEVISLFVDYYGQETSPDGPRLCELTKLKTLRLACRCFSYNHRLLEILYNCISLQADTKHFELLAHTNTSKIAPYVREVTFFPPFHSWTLSFNGFKDTVVSQAIRRYCYDKFGGFTAMDFYGGYAQFVDQHWGGKFPFSDAELEEGYKLHMRVANRGKALLESADLIRQWIKTLGALQNCRNFKIETQTYSGLPDDVPRTPDCSIYQHAHDSQHREEICQQSAAALGDKVFEVAVNCLAQTGIQPTALNLKFESKGEYNWSTLPGWERLDLSKLEKLSFQAMAQSLDEYGDWSAEGEVVIDGRACAALDTLLRWCRKSLTDLFVKRGRHLAPLTWPRQPLLILPELRKIELDEVIVAVGSFAQLLPQLRRLEHFGMTCAGSTSGWKPVFDAVRNHSNRMNVAWHRIAHKYFHHGVFSLRCNTASVSEAKKGPTSRGDMNRSLQNYLAGNGEWNKSLRMWFEKGEDESESDDNNDE